MSNVPTENAPLYSYLASDPDLGEIVELFVDEIPNRIALLLEQLDADDWEGLRRTAHQLKGAAGSYGFTPVSPCAAELERRLREDNPEDLIHQAVDDLVAMCRRMRAGEPD